MKRPFSRLVNVFVILAMVVGLVAPLGAPALAEEGGGPGVTVSIQGPDSVALGDNFTALVAINNVVGFDAADYRVVFNPDVFQLLDVTDGQLTDNVSGNVTAVPVSLWNENPIGSGNFTIINNIDGTPGVNGAGYLAVLSFTAIGPSGGSTEISLVEGTLARFDAQEIPALWQALGLTVYDGEPPAVHHFDVVPWGGTVIAGQPFPLTITARDDRGQRVLTYEASNTLSDNTSTIQPQQTDNFTDGQWTGNVTIFQPALSNIIFTSGGGGATGVTGQSGPFIVLGEPVVGFSQIGDVQVALGFILTIDVRDEQGNIDETFEGTATLTDNTTTIQPQQTDNFTNGVWTGSVTINQPYQGNVIVATASNGAVGKSNPFNVGWNVSGTVSDNVTELPIAGASVWLESQPGGQSYGGPQTGGDGQYSILVPPGDYKLRVEKPGFLPFSQDLQVSSHTTVVVLLDPAAEAPIPRLDIDLIGNQTAGQPFEIFLTARDSQGNVDPSFEGTATLTDNTTTIQPQQTDNFTSGTWLGNVTIYQPYQGNVIEATASNGATGKSNPFNVAGTGLVVSGKVTDNATGLPVAGVEVRLINVSDNVIYSGFTGEDGNYSTVVPQGTYRLRTIKFGYELFALDNFVVDGNKVRNISLLPGGLHHFTIDNIGNQISGVPFQITITGRLQSGAIATGFSGVQSGVVLGDSTGTILPQGTGPNFVGGVWTGNVTVFQPFQGNVIIATAPNTATGQSNPFNVAPAASAGGYFDVSLSPDYISLAPGESANVTITIESYDGFSGNVSISVISYGGTTFGHSFDPSAAVNVPADGQVSVTLRVTVPDWAMPDFYYINIDVTSQNPPRYSSSALMVDVMPPTGWGPSISMTLNFGRPGDLITVNGNNFFGSEGYVLNLTLGGNAVITQPSTIIVSPQGTFSGQFTVPNIPGGRYSLEASVWDTYQYAYADFNVMGGDQKFNMSVNPKWTSVVAEAGQNDTTVMVNLSSVDGTSVSVNVTVEGPPWLTYKLGSLANNTPATVNISAAAASQVSLKLTAGLNTPPGMYSIFVKAREAGKPAVVEVVDLQVMAPEGYGMATLSLVPNMGKVGDKIIVNGIGFPASVQFNQVMVAGQTVMLSQPITTSSTGSFSATFTVPSQLFGWPTLPGTYMVEVNINGVYASAWFTVVGAGDKFIISAVPNWLPPIPPGGNGITMVQVQAIGGSAVSVNLSMDYLPYGLNYSFSPTSVNVPAGGVETAILTLTPTNIPPGHYGADIRGEDADGNTGFAHIEFDIGGSFTDKDWMDQYNIWFPEITLNPTAGPPGTSVTISATDFPAGATVTHLRFAGLELSIPSTTADENGDFTLVFNVPATLWGATTWPGWYGVEVEAQKGFNPPVFIWKDFEVTSADMSFTIKAEPDWLPPIPPGSSSSTTIRVKSLSKGLTVNLSIENLPWGMDYSFSKTSLNVTPGGSATSTLTLTPNRIPPGWYGVDIKGVDGNWEGWTRVDFQVGGGTDTDWMNQNNIWFPEIVLNPMVGPAGSKVTITATNFPAGANVTALRFAGENLAIPPTTADVNGSFTLQFNVPTTLWG
ncbi:MAG: carboxypeptidase regulatory-like domain-containing protein, partial [Chloroflexi bacterium]|nr:carboxypeptidase regulatory-like domain-containing protein [Chloroflexota bacterium]